MYSSSSNVYYLFMPPRRSEIDRAKYWGLRNERGFTQKQAAKEIGISVQTARAWERGLRNNSGDAYRERLKEQALQPPKRLHQLSKEAKQAYDDFAYFRRRYFGRLSSPWQEDAGYKFVELLKTDKREYVVLNCPPGAGKALSLDTPLLTPSGWSTMGEIQVGDYVFNEEGKPTKVIAKSEVFHGHDCYEVKSDDGAHVVADAGHLWNVRLNGLVQYEARTTEFLARQRGNRFQLQVLEPANFANTELPIDLHVLGITCRYLTVTPIESVPTQCIQVDSPSHLYLAGEGLMVTHNSKLLMDIEAWLTCRNRALRGLIGSATQKKADGFARALRRELERIVPLKGEPAEVAAGRALDALATMAADFGRFQPEQGDVWRANEFVVAQLDDIAISEKESTWQSFGLDGDYLGNRVDISVWDDVVTEKTLKTIERIMDQRRKWDKEVETRLEPEGLLALVMQRKGPEDLSRHCLDKMGGDDDFEDEPDETEDHLAIVDPEGSTITRKYHHFKYPAHDDSRCQGYHSRKQPLYWAPNDAKGCLLDPIRLSWTDLQGFQRTDGEDYLVTYQQEETDPTSVLINRLWIKGGTDPLTGEHYFGCYDKDRGLMQLPPLEGELYSTLAVDPSGVNYWGLLWTIFQPSSELRFLMNADSRKMSSSQFLDWDYSNKVWTGVLEEWWQDSARIGHPIRNLIFERNAAQRYFGQSNTFNRWCQIRGVSYYPHDTSDSNKNSKELGVQSIAPHFRYGRWRLPNQGNGDWGYVASAKLVDELCVYPRGMRTDLVMATWFTEFWLPRIVVPQAENIVRPDIPQWMGTVVA